MWRRSFKLVSLGANHNGAWLAAREFSGDEYSGLETARLRSATGEAARLSVPSKALGAFIGYEAVRVDP
jgi:hypothetical protein